MSKKKLKPLILLTLIATVCFIILSGCTKSPSANSPSDTGNTDSTDPNVKTISLSVLNNEAFYDQIIQKFEAAHPNIHVEIKAYNATPVDSSRSRVKQVGSSNLESAQKQRDLEKFTDSISTELASGKGSDIIATNYLPYKKYADKHLLANIQDLMKNDPGFEPNNYYMNVFDTMKYKNGYYAIPTSVQFTNIWVGDSTIVGNGKVDDSKWSWKQFVDQVTPLIPAGGRAIDAMSIDNLLLAMLNPGIDHFIDSANKKASFDSPEFKDLLNLAKSMVDSKVVAAEKLDSLNLFSTQPIFQIGDLVIMTQAEFDGKGALFRAPSVIPEQGYSYRSELALSINDKTKNKQEAWEFIKFVLSDRIQADHDLSGIPVNKSAFHQMQSMLKDPGVFKNDKVSINGKEITLKAPTPQEVDRLETFITGINSVQETDDKIKFIVFDELAPFFSGQKSADEVVKAIQSKVNTYLNE